MSSYLALVTGAILGSSFRYFFTLWVESPPSDLPVCGAQCTGSLRRCHGYVFTHRHHWFLSVWGELHVCLAHYCLLHYPNSRWHSTGSHPHVRGYQPASHRCDCCDSDLWRSLGLLGCLLRHTLGHIDQFHHQGLADGTGTTLLFLSEAIDRTKLHFTK